MIYETVTNDVTLAPTYDGLARMTRQPWSSNSTDLVAFNYVYDAADNVLTRTFDHRSSDPVEAYGYDSLHRLTHTVYGQKTSTPYEGYIYDGLSNRLTLDNNGTPTAAMFNAVNEMTKHGTPGSEITVEYSKTGNLTKNSGGYQFFYDRSNQLTRIEDASSNAVASYAYDALGRRIERIDEKASTTLRFYYTDQRVIEDTDGSSTVQRHYIWGNYIDELLLMRDVAGVGGTANEDLVVLRDERFSPTALVKRSDGSIVERYENDAFGKTNFLNADFTVKGTQQSAFGLRYTYTGRELDILDGGGFTIMYFRGRYYDPATGAFYQRDPIGYPDGYNAYAAYFALWGGMDPYGFSSDWDPDRPNWNHLVPQALKGELGDMIDASDFGWLMRAEDHQTLHRNGWNDAWKDWLDNFKETNERLPNKDDLVKQCDVMKNSDKFKDIIAKGFPTKMGYTDWAKKSKAVKALKNKLAKKLAKLGAKKAGKTVAGSIPIVSIFVSLWDYPARADTYGAWPAVGLTVLDNIPLADIAVSGTEAIDEYEQQKRKADRQMANEMDRLIHEAKDNP